MGVRTRLTPCQQGFAGIAPAHPWAGWRTNQYALFGGLLSNSGTSDGGDIGIEIGIRRALGADTARVARLVLGNVVKLLALAAGRAVRVAPSQSLRSE